MACAHTAREGPCSPLLELRAQLPHCRAAMTEPVLDVGLKLGRGQLELGEPEIRVIAEAAAAARRVEYESLPHTCGSERRRIRRRGDENQCAPVASPAPLRG